MEKRESRSKEVKKQRNPADARDRNALALIAAFASSELPAYETGHLVGHRI
jgi:hypothetical protein